MGLLALGRAFGRWAALTFAVALVPVAAVAEALWPGGRENPGPGLAAFGLPLFVLLILLGSVRRPAGGERSQRRAPAS